MERGFGVRRDGHSPTLAGELENQTIISKAAKMHVALQTTCCTRERTEEAYIGMTHPIVISRDSFVSFIKD